MGVPVSARFFVLFALVAVATGCGSQATGSKFLPRFFSFPSRPDLHPPSVTIKQNRSAVSPGYIFSRRRSRSSSKAR
jgi:hypothetical protein